MKIYRFPNKLIINGVFIHDNRIVAIDNKSIERRSNVIMSEYHEMKYSSKVSKKNVCIFKV